MTTSDKLKLGQGNPLFTTQFRALSEGIAGNGILASGDLAVSADPDTELGLLVDAGGVHYDGDDHRLEEQTSLMLSAGDADHNRWDTVVFDTDEGAPAILEGTAE